MLYYDVVKYDLFSFKKKEKNPTNVVNILRMFNFLFAFAFNIDLFLIGCSHNCFVDIIVMPCNQRINSNFSLHVESSLHYLIVIHDKVFCYS